MRVETVVARAFTCIFLVAKGFNATQTQTRFQAWKMPKTLYDHHCFAHFFECFFSGFFLKNISPVRNSPAGCLISLNALDSSEHSASA